MSLTSKLSQLLSIAASILVFVALPVQSAHAAAACCEAAPVEAAAAHSDESLFNVESQWQNNQGGTGTLSQVGTRPQLVAMVYTTCQFACPRIIADLKSIESAIGNDTLSDYGITLITFDPERDTIEAFRAYAETQELDPARWTFLRGSAGDILEIANLLGVKYKQLPNGEFSHSNIITLLNPKGEIVYQLDGLGAKPDELIKQTKALIEQSK